MSFAIAAAGTGGHVFPGLAVGEALVGLGVERDDVLYVGGGRLEAEVYPQAGFPFLGVELRGLQRRRLTASNFGIVRVVWRATGDVAAAYRERQVRVVLALGGYVTVPAGWAARRVGATLFLHEQNAEAGLANRLVARWAAEVLTSFPATGRLPRARWTGNPIRAALANFDRVSLRPEAFDRYRLHPGIPVLGVFGGSLGAGVINEAVERMMKSSQAVPFQVLHLAGGAHAQRLAEVAGDNSQWKVVGFEEEMEFFYAVSDLVVARAGGAVAELTATATPAVLVPGRFGSGAHQVANARALAESGAAVVLAEDELDRLPETAAALINDPQALAAMARASATLARPRAAKEVAEILVDAHG